VNVRTDDDPGPAEAVLARLSLLDRFLPVWIGVAMLAGLALGALVPRFDDALRIGTISLPIAIGLLVMMYPVLARVRYEEVGSLRGEWRLFGALLALNWVIGPALMFTLAWLLLPDQPEYRTGLIIVGLARCIAMVLIWSDLACADAEATALLVALSSLFQIVAYSLLGWFYLTALPGWLGLDTQGFEVGIWEVARTVLIFLGIPLAAGYLTRRIGIRRRGRDWYEQRFLPRIPSRSSAGCRARSLRRRCSSGRSSARPKLVVALLVMFSSTRSTWRRRRSLTRRGSSGSGACCEGSWT